MISYLFSFCFPFLLIMVAFQSGVRLLGWKPSGLRATFILVTLSTAIILLPVKGLPLARWIISVNANFSIPLTAILFCKALENASNVNLLDEKARQATWIFGLIAGVLLYPTALGLGSIDLYQGGWSFSWLFVLLMATTIFFLLKKNRFALVLMMGVLAYNLRILESENLWDYMVDPFLFLASALFLGARSCLKRSHRNVHTPG